MKNIDKVYVFTSFNEDDWDFETKAFENYEDAIANQYDWVKEVCENYGIDCPETLDDITDEMEEFYRNTENDFVCVNADCTLGDERIYSKITETELQ